jgi:hypothetical protein
VAVSKNFKIQNGLEVDTNLIFANTGSNKVGIATTNPQYTLHVRGGIGAINSVITGVSTVNDLIIGGKVSVGSSFGTAGQYLVSTGAGVSWGAVPTVRSTDLQTAGVGATTFNTTYAVGLIDVYVNGVKLSADEYTASNGATVVLDDACFGGETVEFISYSPFGIGIGGTSIQGITILDEGSPVGSALQVTSINFVGAAVTAVGSGIGVTVYLSNFVASAGIATFATTAGVATYSSSAGIATYADTAGISTYADIAGISTYSSSAGIATYADIAGISTYADIAGISTYSSSAGIATYADIAGISTYSSSAGIATYADTAGISTNVIGGIASVTSVTAGIITATSGFISVGNTTPVTIQLIGNQLTFNAVGIGSTTFTLF